MQLREQGLDLTASNLKCIAETQVLRTRKNNLFINLKMCKQAISCVGIVWLDKDIHKVQNSTD